MAHSISGVARRFGLAFVVAVLMAGVLAQTVVAQNSLSARDVDKLVEEYCSAGTGVERRGEIVAELQGTPESRTRRYLQSAIREAATREAGIRLAMALRFSKAWDLIEPVIDGDDAAAILKLLTEIGSPDVVEAVADYWAKKLEPTAPAFATLSEQFLMAGVSEKAMGVLIKALDDAARAEAAAKILRAHLELAGDASIDAIKAKWRDTSRIYGEQAKAWELAGRNIFVDAAIDGKRTRPTDMFGDDQQVQAESSLPSPDYMKRRGGNYLLEYRQSIIFRNLAPYETKAHTVILRFMPMPGAAGFRIGYTAGRHQFVGEAIENELHVTVQQRQYKASFKPGEWNELKFQVLQGRTPGAEGRRVIVTLNGLPFTAIGNNPGFGPGGPNGGMGGPGGRGPRNNRNSGAWPFDMPLDSISAIGPHTGQVVVGGCELIVD